MVFFLRNFVPLWHFLITILNMRKTKKQFITEIWQDLNFSILFSDAEELWVLVSMIDYEHAVQIVESANITSDKMHFVIGLDMATEPKALTYLVNMGVDVMVFLSTMSRCLKSNVFAAKTAKGSKVLIGSAPMVEMQGMYCEKMAIFTTDDNAFQKVMTWYNEMIDDNRVIIIDEEIARYYNKEYEDRRFAQHHKELTDSKRRLCEFLKKATVGELAMRKGDVIRELTAIKDGLSGALLADYHNIHHELVGIRNIMDIDNHCKHFDMEVFESLWPYRRLVKNLSSYKSLNLPEMVDVIISYYAEGQDMDDERLPSYYSYVIGPRYTSLVLNAYNTEKYAIFTIATIELMRYFDFTIRRNRMEWSKYEYICKFMRELAAAVGAPDLAHLQFLVELWWKQKQKKAQEVEKKVE